jgi:uncharacterized iron-regulated protein
MTRSVPAAKPRSLLGAPWGARSVPAAKPRSLLGAPWGARSVPAAKPRSLLGAHRLLAPAAALALAAACAPRFDPRLVEAPVAGRTWLSTEERSHPLVGKIWDARAARFVDEATLSAALAGADFAVLGETHDNPDHHLLQARLLRAIIAAGRRPALAFEMLNADQQTAVDASLAAAPHDPDALGSAVGWAATRWPDFEWYRPIFAAGLEAGLPVVAANLPRAQVREIVSKGRDALDEGLRVRLAREEPIPDAVMSGLRKEMNESHCGELPDAMVDPLVLAQRARDARMAERMSTAGAERGAVLIAGTGHARTDRGVPAGLARDAPGRKVVSVAFVEADAAAHDPAAYAKEWGTPSLPFDFAVFTPRTKRGDPCAGIRHVMEKKREKERREKEAAPDAGAPGAAKPSAP